MTLGAGSLGHRGNHIRAKTTNNNTPTEVIAILEVPNVEIIPEFFSIGEFIVENW